MSKFRFDVGLSFAGTDRDSRVLPIAKLLATHLGDSKVFYDNLFEHKIHGLAMDEVLARTYTQDCLLVVVCLSQSYLKREWCAREWEAIRRWSDGFERGPNSSQRLRLAILNLDNTPIDQLPGVNSRFGFYPVEKHTDQQVVKFILDRLWEVKGLMQVRGNDLVFSPNPHVAFQSVCGATLVPIAASTFTMGTPRSLFGKAHDETQHEVRLTRGFHMSRTPITQAQWTSIMGIDRNPSEFVGDEHPVENVSWEDCQSFCRFLTDRDAAARITPRTFRYRLPTEAEWEYACRAGTTTPYLWGRRLEGGREFAKLYDRASARVLPLPWMPAPWEGGFAKTAPVGRHKPNDFGLHDMIGNVWEWCQDWYGPYDLSTVDNPRGPQSGTLRVVRGSSWYDDPNQTARSACRQKLDPRTRSRHVGFRIVAE